MYGGEGGIFDVTVKCHVIYLVIINKNIGSVYCHQGDSQDNSNSP